MRFQRLPAVAILIPLLVGLAACGPGESTRSVLFFLKAGAKNNIRRIEFEATPTAGEFVGSDGGCVFSAAAGTPQAEDDLEVTQTGSLYVLKASSSSPLGAGSVVVSCQMADDGIDPEFIEPIDVLSCKVGNNNSANPDSDCPITFQEETVPECGNEVQEAPEECDDGADNGDDKPCLENCIAAECGDGEVCDDTDCDTGPNGDPEECDDGNTINTDSCNSDCETTTPQ